MTVSIDLPSAPFAPVPQELLSPGAALRRSSGTPRGSARLALAPGFHDRALLLHLGIGDPRADQRPAWAQSTQTLSTYGLTAAVELMKWCREQHIEADFNLTDFIAVQQRQGGTLQASVLEGGAFRVWLRGGLDPDRQAVTHRCAAYSRKGTEERFHLPDIDTLLRFAQQHRMALKFKLRGGECVDPHDLPGVRDTLRPQTPLLR